MANCGDSGSVPENANEQCPGTQSETAGKAEACAGCPNQHICATEPKGPDAVLHSSLEHATCIQLAMLYWQWALVVSPFSLAIALSS